MERKTFVLLVFLNLGFFFWNIKFGHCQIHGTQFILPSQFHTKTKHTHQVNLLHFPSTSFALHPKPGVKWKSGKSAIKRYLARSFILQFMARVWEEAAHCFLMVCNRIIFLGCGFPGYAELWLHGYLAWKKWVGRSRLSGLKHVAVGMGKPKESLSCLMVFLQAAELLGSFVILLFNAVCCQQRSHLLAH